MFSFQYWLDRAKKGDDFAARLMWSILASDLQQRRLSDNQLRVLSDLLDAIAKPRVPNKVFLAANGALALGRRPGRKPKHVVEDEQYRLASDVFDRVGEARGKTLNDACHEVLMAHRGDVTDLRAIRAAYKIHLPHLLFLQRTARENEGSSK